MLVLSSSREVTRGSEAEAGTSIVEVTAFPASPASEMVTSSQAGSDWRQQLGVNLAREEENGVICSKSHADRR